MILNGVPVTPTGTFPYISVGPVDFSQLNFVKTTQTDFYYCVDPTGDTSNTVVCSKVVQSYDPTTAMLMIGTLIIAFFIALGWGISKVRRMGK